jgi:branched-chain amino acid transport system substrate-binding protein
LTRQYAKRWWAVLLVAGLFVAACGRDTGTPTSTTYTDPGITDTQITLGASIPLSGAVSGFSSVGKGVAAYFKYINETKGGFKFGDGKTRKVNFITYDDGYDPQRALANAKQMVEQDKIFATFNTFGSAPSLAMRPYMIQNKVPMIFVSASASIFGDPVQSPNSLPCCVVANTEGPITARYFKTAQPNAKIGVLYQNDDFGKGIFNGFQGELAKGGPSIVSSQSYEVTDATVDSQIVSLKAAGADAVYIIATPKFAAQALKKINDLGWKPLRFLQTSGASVSTTLTPVGLDVSKGVLSLAWYKDPTDPRWANDAAMTEFKTNIVKYGDNLKPTDSLAVTGWMFAQMGAIVFAKMKKPTRQGMLDAAFSLNGEKAAMFLPGMELHTDATHHYPMETMYVEVFDGTTWQIQGNVISAVGQTKP